MIVAVAFLIAMQTAQAIVIVGMLRRRIRFVEALRCEADAVRDFSQSRLALLATAKSACDL